VDAVVFGFGHGVKAAVDVLLARPGQAADGHGAIGANAMREGSGGGGLMCANGGGKSQPQGTPKWGREAEGAPLGLQRAHFVGNRRDGLKVAIRGNGEPGLADGHTQARELMGDCELLRGLERDAGRLLTCDGKSVQEG
jgi:hypothetical protein